MLTTLMARKHLGSLGKMRVFVPQKVAMIGLEIQMVAEMAGKMLAVMYGFQQAQPLQGVEMLTAAPIGMFKPLAAAM
jgi:hypothetical protein